MIKRQARRLINTAFAALTAEGSTAVAALAASRETLAQFAAAPTWKERAVIRSFLDCAEIAVAVALAYDWLFDALSATERRDLEDAFHRNVLAPAHQAYLDPDVQWPRRRDNCTLVSNAGILIGALCALPCHGELAAELIGYSLTSTWNVLSGMAPDGAWREGLSYWSLAMRYAGLMVGALESTLGSSFGLADQPGFPQTGDFALHAVGPSGAAFNFGDSELSYDVSSLAWFAHRFGRPIDGWLLRETEGWYLPFQSIWPNPVGASPGVLGVPTGKVFLSGDLACFRNTWSSAAQARPVYLAIKGGNIRTRYRHHSEPLTDEILAHTQADAGTFVVDGARQRWVLDLGSDDYDLPGYFDHGRDGRSGQRWEYYRSQAAGHNTLLFEGCDQIPDSPAPIIGSCADGDSKWVVLDLSSAYGQPTGTVRRGAALLGRQVVIQDEIDPKIGIKFTWALHTAAEPVALGGSLARFRLGEDRFDAHILEPVGARFEISPPPPPRVFQPADVHQMHGRAAGDLRPISELPRFAQEAGEHKCRRPIQRLQIRLPAGTARVTVLLLPDCDGSELVLPVTSIGHWLARRPVRLMDVTPRRSRVRRSHPLPRKPFPLRAGPFENTVGMILRGAQDHV